MNPRNFAAACVLASCVAALQANAQTAEPVAARNVDAPASQPWQVANLIPAAAGRKKVVELQGKGAQVYTCEASPTDFGWRLKEPEAKLLDGAGGEFGRHFTGPSWQARDGSTVVGEVVVSNPAPKPDSIPWLLLRAKSHSGSGVFASVGYIARISTEGGLAPATGCDASHAGVELRVPYSALYVFFTS